MPAFGVLDETAASVVATDDDATSAECSFIGVEARESPASLPLELVLSFFFGLSVPPVAVEQSGLVRQMLCMGLLVVSLPPVGMALFLFLAEPLLACSLETSF